MKISLMHYSNFSQSVHFYIAPRSCIVGLFLARTKQNLLRYSETDAAF